MNDPCSCHDYRWCQSAEEAHRLEEDGWEYAGESGRYPSVILRRRTVHCGNCTRRTREVLDDLGRYVQTCNAFPPETGGTNV